MVSVKSPKVSILRNVFNEIQCKGFFKYCKHTLTLNKSSFEIPKWVKYSCLVFIHNIIFRGSESWTEFKISLIIEKIWSPVPFFLFHKSEYFLRISEESNVLSLTSPTSFFSGPKFNNSEYSILILSKISIWRSIGLRSISIIGVDKEDSKDWFNKLLKDFADSIGKRFGFRILNKVW